MSGSSGGSTTQVIQPTPAPAPSTAEAIREYVQSLPALYEAQLKYAPLEAQQQVQLAQQYAIPYAQAYQQAQETLYPGTTSLQEQLAKQAQEGMTAGVPQAMQDQYRSDMMAQLGENAKAGVGADYVSRNMINQQQQYQQYYQNLGLSLAGRQPLVNAASPSYTNQLGNYSPGQGLSYTAGTYGTFTGASQPIVTQQQTGTPNWMLGLQSGMNAAGQLGGAAIMMCWVAAELFGGWHVPSTQNARKYIIARSPMWFFKLYMSKGEQFARFIATRPLLKRMLTPLFKWFAKQGSTLR